MVLASKTGGYPSLEDIFEAVRLVSNDWQAGLSLTPGEGQITTDNIIQSPQTFPALKSALRELYRKLRLVGDPTFIRDNVQVAIPANGATGPNIQTNLSFQGYFDGATLQTNVTLPSDLMFPLFLWEQQQGSGLPFVPMTQPEAGLPSPMQQTFSLGQWEWRGGGNGYIAGVNGSDAIWFIGTLNPEILRLRYMAALPQFLSPQLTITSWSISAGNVTFQAINTLAAQQTVRLSGFNVSTFFNGQSVSVLSATPTSFTVIFSQATGQSDSGYAQPTLNYSQQFANTYIPVQDCEEFLAYRIASKIQKAISGVTASTSDLSQEADAAIMELRNEQVRRAQTIDYSRKSYGISNTWGGQWGGQNDNLL